MKQIDLDSADQRVKQFIQMLPLEPDGVQLTLKGQVICKVVSPNTLTDAERDAVLAAGWNRIRAAQQRNQGVPAKVIAREVCDAVEEVRRRSGP